MSAESAPDADSRDGIIRVELALERDGRAVFEAEWVLSALRMGVAAWEAAPAPSMVEAATRHVKIECVAAWRDELENEIRLTKGRRNAAHTAAAKRERKRGG